MSFISSLKERFAAKDNKDIYLSGFRKAKATFSDQIKELRYQFNGVDAAFLEELTIVLLESDVGIETAELICQKLKAKCEAYPELTFHWAINFLLEIMKEIYMEFPDRPLYYNETSTTVILLEGVNGSGKTTTAAKLASMYMREGRTVAFTAADTFRAGAIEQMARWGEKLNVPCIKGRPNGDPSAAIVDGCRYAKEHDIDILLCDTAGRLQNKVTLMAELEKMHRVAGKEIDGAPHNTLLVLDATTGQNGLSQAEIFSSCTKLTGIILTKMDGTAKGGIILAIKHKLHLPVYFIGLGEGENDLCPFDLDSYLYSISEGIDHG